MRKVAEEFQDVKFEHATGYKSNDTNFANYGLRLYQARHVQGIIAGMMTKTNKICYASPSSPSKKLSLKTPNTY